MTCTTKTTIIGGLGGSPFSLTADYRTTLKKIYVWVGDQQIKAVRVLLSDGGDQTFGVPSESAQEYTFSEGECFRSLSLWANGDGTRLGAINFTTSKDGSFFVRIPLDNLPKKNVIDVGTGTCLGIVGRSGDDIDSMGFMFVSEN